MPKATCVNCEAVRDATKLKRTQYYDEARRLIIISKCLDGKCEIREKRMSTSKLWNKFYTR